MSFLTDTHPKNMNHTKPDLILKAAFVGEYGVGKTSLFQRYVYDTLTHQPTIGVDFMPQTEHVGDWEVNIHLWDTAGQERFRSIVCSYFRSTYLFLLVFDVTNRESFLKLNDWIDMIRKDTIYGYRVLLIANKADLPNHVVSSDEIDAFAAAHGVDAGDVHMVSAEATDDPAVVRMFRKTVASVVENVEYIEAFSGLINRRVTVPRVARNTTRPSMLTTLFGPSYNDQTELDTPPGSPSRWTHTPDPPDPPPIGRTDGKSNESHRRVPWLELDTTLGFNSGRTRHNMNCC